MEARLELRTGGVDPLISRAGVRQILGARDLAESPTKLQSAQHLDCAAVKLGVSAANWVVVGRVANPP